MIENPQKEYMLDNYGTCKLGAKCECRIHGWKGQICGDWVPLGVTSFQQYLDYLKKRKN